MCNNEDDIDAEWRTQEVRDALEILVSGETSQPCRSWQQEEQKIWREVYELIINDPTVAKLLVQELLTEEDLNNHPEFSAIVPETEPTQTVTIPKGFFGRFYFLMFLQAEIRRGITQAECQEEMKQDADAVARITRHSPYLLGANRWRTVFDPQVVANSLKAAMVEKAVKDKDYRIDIREIIAKPDAANRPTNMFQDVIRYLTDRHFTEFQSSAEKEGQKINRPYHYLFRQYLSKFLIPFFGADATPERGSRLSETLHKYSF